MALVAGVDSSTQSCKIVIRDAETGAMVRSGRASHPDGTEVDPAAWESALWQAVEQAGGLDDVAALAVGGQQHGMVTLDSDGAVIRRALLWNDTRSAQAAADLVTELGDGDAAAGMAAWAHAIGSVPVASLTVTKLRWLAEHEPDNAAKVAAVALPHDWLTWRLAQSLGARATLDTLVTDRSDASGTGYWSPFTEDYRRDLLVRGLGHDAVLPAVIGPRTAAPFSTRITFGPGAGDNAAAALGLSLGVGDVAVSIGTSGVVSAICTVPVADPSGMVTGFADATGAYLPLACTLNASRIVDHVAGLLGVGYRDFDELAMSAEPGAGGVVLVPYFDGERTPDRPTATASFHGLTADTTTRAALARAAVEGLLCSLADGMAALRRVGVPVERVFLLGGGAKSTAVRTIAPAVLGQDVLVPAAGEYVADGAARQAAWVLSGADEPPVWSLGEVLRFTADPTPWVLDRYAEARDLGQLARG